MPAPVIPDLTPAPPAPLRTQAPATFTLTAETFVDWQADFPDQMNLVIDAIEDTVAYMEGLTGSSGPITATSLTMATGKLLGRYSASTGAIQEITISTGLALDGSGNLTATGGYTDAQARAAVHSAPTSQTGTSYTAVLADANTYIRFSNASAITFTIPPNSAVAFPIGTVIEMEQAGAGALSVAVGAGVTINSRSADLTLAGQYAVAFVKKVATDTWTMNGDL